jgi:hypothetical protein
MLSLDQDPGEEPRPSEQDEAGGMETEDELAEDMSASPAQGLDVEDMLEGAFLSGPEEDGDGGMETEEETRSPGAGG